MALASSRQEEPVEDKGVVLLLQVPRTNDQKELAAEQMFASLHGLLLTPSTSLFKGPRRERLSFEIAVRAKRIGFYVWVPEYLKAYVEEQIYAQYPTVHISEVEDYALYREEDHYPTQLVTELKFVGNNALPIKTFQSFEVDPLASITATLAKFTEGEEAWLQLLIKPADHNWHKSSERYIAGLKSPGSTGTTGLVSMLWKAPEAKEGGGKISEGNSTKASAAQLKSQKTAFETQLRIVYRGNTTKQQAQLQMQSIIAAYKQFNSTYLNGFDAKRVVDDPFMVAHFRSRAFNKKGFICNIEEVATLYHLPHTSVETPFIMWATSQTAEPPANLPVVTPETQADMSPIAATNFRGHNTMFGIPRSDRGRHLYIIGQTGAGKSGMLELLTISDIYSPYGFAVIDPHGDYAQAVLRRIPAERAADVVYFNPADTDFPMGFNPLEVYDPALKNHTASELIGVIKRIFENSWGPRLEYILRYCILALLDFPEATMLDITRILTEKKFRNEVLSHVLDPVVRNFWTIEFASWNDKFMAEAVAPILNKVGAFTANPLVRNIIGNPKSSFNIRQIMDERKILLVNLSRGLVGEDNAALLGALLVTKVQMAAMSRADIPGEKRTPFYLYVDEFQNFATDSFATILSEARKYGLSLTVANQYTAQMMPEVKDAVFGNVGSIISFRTSADDAKTMLKYFEPKFTDYDIVHMNNRNFAISMTIGGEKVGAFSAVSLNLPPFDTDYSDQIIAHSRAKYAQSREYIEKYVADRYLTQENAQAKQTEPKMTKPRQEARVQSLKPGGSNAPAQGKGGNKPAAGAVKAGDAKTANSKSTSGVNTAADPRPAVAATVSKPVLAVPPKPVGKNPAAILSHAILSRITGVVSAPAPATPSEAPPVPAPAAKPKAVPVERPAAAPAPEVPAGQEGEAPAKAKRKRKRNRKKKGSGESTAPAEGLQAVVLARGETTTPRSAGRSAGGSAENPQANAAERAAPALVRDVPDKPSPVTDASAANAAKPRERKSEQPSAAPASSEKLAAPRAVDKPAATPVQAMAAPAPAAKPVAPKPQLTAKSEPLSAPKSGVFTDDGVIRLQ